MSLCGSDFTGLGIEICGSRKDGIYVMKVMPQGPAATVVRAGDKIISITIDLQHMVQEDAANILSYASPYNVQLELVDGNGTLPRLSASPAHSRPTTTVNNGLAAPAHPLHARASSGPDDIGATIEHNAKRKLFPQQHQPSHTSHDEINNYPTLKLEAPADSIAVTPVTAIPIEQLSSTTTTTTTTVHRENEKLQQHSAASATNDVVSSSTNQHAESLAPHSPKPFEVPAAPQPLPQADDDPATLSAPPPPPLVNKRTKHLKSIETVAADVTTASPLDHIEQPHHLQRAGSITSSGIRRDAAGIPQEIPDQMFAAAMAARGNRKSVANLAEATTDTDDEPNRTANKKAPRPPARGDSLAEGSRLSVKATGASVAADVTTIDIGGVDDGTVVELVPTAVANSRRSNVEQAVSDNNGKISFSVIGLY